MGNGKISNVPVYLVWFIVFCGICILTYVNYSDVHSDKMCQEKIDNLQAYYNYVSEDYYNCCFIDTTFEDNQYKNFKNCTGFIRQK